MVTLFLLSLVALPPDKCQETLTYVNEGKTKLCAGDIIFEEDFDDDINKTWNIDHFIPVNSKVRLK